MTDEKKDSLSQRLQRDICAYLREHDRQYLEKFMIDAKPLMKKLARQIQENNNLPLDTREDIQQVCAEGFLRALSSYDLSKGASFLSYARKYFIQGAISEFMQSAQSGLTVHGKYEYRMLRKVMWIYGNYEGDRDITAVISEKTGLSQKRVAAYIRDGLQNMNVSPLYVLPPGEEEEYAVRVDPLYHSADPAQVFMRAHRTDVMLEAFDHLTYREKDIVSRFLGFCPVCLNTVTADGEPRELLFFEDLAVYYGKTAEAISNTYHKAIGKLRKALLENT